MKCSLLFILLFVCSSLFAQREIVRKNELIDSLYNKAPKHSPTFTGKMNADKGQFNSLEVGNNNAEGNGLYLASSFYYGEYP